MHTIQWRRPQVDLSELARLRGIENWSTARLALEMRVGRKQSLNAVNWHYPLRRQGAQSFYTQNFYDFRYFRSITKFCVVQLKFVSRQIGVGANLGRVLNLPRF